MTDGIPAHVVGVFVAVAVAVPSALASGPIKGERYSSGSIKTSGWLVRIRTNRQ